MDAEDVQRQINQTLQHANNEILSSFSELLDSRLADVQKSIKENQRCIAERQEAKFEEVMTDGYKFRKRGNEEQHKHNVKVLHKLEDARKELQEHKVEEARQRIVEGLDIVKHRQKLIRLADSSEAGWRTVDEYVRNPIASDSEDEKKINKAQGRAERKVKDARRRREKFRETTRPYPKTEPQPNSSNTGIWRSGKCYRCNKRGHWRKDCTEKLEENKISELLENSNHLIEKAIKGNIARDSANQSSDKFTSPVGRLRENVGQWRSIGASSFVLDVLKFGYKMPLFSTPEDIELQNNKSAVNNQKFVSEEIKRLLDRGCISEVNTKPRVVNPLTVAGNKFKQRLVLDCRHVNPHLFKYKHKYEDASTSRHLFQLGDYLFAFDLKSAYHHIAMHELDKEYLGFRWHGKYYVFQVLPFGLSTAGYIFSKVMREVVKYWRSQGFRIVMYLDDGIGGSSSLTDAEMVCARIQADLNRLGFLVAIEKCQWEPVQTLVWLGLVWDTKNNTITLSESRIEKLKFNIDCILKGYELGYLLFDVRSVASVVGQVISAKIAFGTVVRLRTRYLYFCIQTRSSWNSFIRLSLEAVSELRFWLESIDKMNRKGSLISQLTVSDVDRMALYCDASESGFGGHLTLCSEGEHIDYEVFGIWNAWECSQSSTWRELETVNRVLKNSVDIVGGNSVEVYSDNQNVQHILKVGSKTKLLQDIAMSVHGFCEGKNIDLNCTWVPRKENTKADSLSRISCCDDWAIKENVFDYFNQLWGPHTYDRFATRYNTKCSLFNSKTWCAGTSGVDAFEQVWSSDVNWLVPPPALIPEVVRKIEKEKCKCTLVVPEWTSAPFWPMLIENQGNFRYYVKSYARIKNVNCICRGHGNNGIFGKQGVFFNMLFVHIEF